MRRPRHAEPFASPVAMKARSGRLKAAEICVKAGAERKEHVVQAKGTGHGGKKIMHACLLFMLGGCSVSESPLWVLLGRPLAGSFNIHLLAATERGELFAAGTAYPSPLYAVRQVYRSEDGGESWSESI